MPLSLNEEEELELEMEMAKGRLRQQTKQAENLDSEIASRQPSPPQEAKKKSHVVQFMEDNPEMKNGGIMDAVSNLPGFMLANAKDWTQDNLGINMIGGTANAAKNIVQTGAAIGDKALGTENARRIEENIPEFQAESPAGQLTADMTGIGAGMAVPAVGLAKRGTDLVGIARMLSNLGKFTAVNAGGVASMNAGEQPIALGDKAFLPEMVNDGNKEIAEAIGSLGLQEDGTYSETLLKNKLNLLTEAMVLAKPVEFAGRAAVGASKFVMKDMLWDSLVGWKNMDKKKQRVIKDLVLEMRYIPHTASQKEREAQIIDLAKRLEENADVFMPSNTPGVDDVNYQRSTAEAYSRSGVTPTERARMSGAQASVVSGGAPQTEAAMAQPSLNLDRVAQQADRAFGGKAGTEMSRQKINQTYREDVGNFDNDIRRQTEEIQKAKTDADSIMRNDEFLGSDMSKMEQGGINLRTGKEVDDITDTMGELHNTNKDEIIAESNRNYKAVEESGSPADMESWQTARAEVEDLIPKDIKKLMDEAEAEGTYGALKTKVLPTLNEEIDDLMGGDRIARAKGRKLITLRDNINKDQMDVLEQGTDEYGFDNRTAQEARRANKYFKEEVAPNRQGLSDKLTDIQRDNRLRPEDAKVESRKAIQSTLNDPQSAEHSQRFAKLVNDPEIVDAYVKANIRKDFSDIIQKEGLDGADPVKIADALRKNLPLMSDQQVDKAQGFLNTVQKRRREIEGMEETVKGTRAEKDDFVRQMDSGEMKGFKDQSGLTQLDADTVFKEYLNDPKGGNNLKNILNRADRSGQDVREGLKSHWVRTYRDKSYRGGTGPAGERNINEQTQNAIQSGDNKLIEYGKEIFSDDDTIVHMMDRLSKEAVEASNIKSAKQINFHPINRSDKDARGAIDFAITQVFGQLNRWGARLRSATGRAISGSSANQITQDAKDFVMANPKEAAALIRDLAKTEGKKMNPVMKKRLYQYMVLNGVYQANKEDEERFVNDVDTQTENLK